MGIRLKLDENLPVSAAEILRAAGHDATTAAAEGLAGEPDRVIAAACREERRALVTLDQGLGNIRSYPPREYAGIIVLRPREQGLDSVLAMPRRLVMLLQVRSPEAALWILDSRRLRIRR